MMRFGVSLFVISILASTATADTELEALQHLDKGIRLFEQQNFEQARFAFTRARDLAPKKPNPHRWLGLVEAELGSCAEAIAELEYFLELVSPKDPRTVEARAVRDRCRAEIQPKVGTLEVDSAHRQQKCV